MASGAGGTPAVRSGWEREVEAKEKAEASAGADAAGAAETEREEACEEGP